MSTAKHRKGQKGERRTSGAGGPAMRDIASPRYHQVYVTLRTWVRDGTYRPGDQIPTEPELCRMFDVSRITVRKAIDDLAREGWLVRQQGKGTFVQLSSARPAASLDLDEARSQVADLAAATEVRGVTMAELLPDEETRAALDLPVDAKVQRASHVRVLRGVPLGLITTFVPLEVAARVSQLETPQQPMFELLGKAGIEVARAEQIETAERRLRLPMRLVAFDFRKRRRGHWRGDCPRHDAIGRHLVFAELRCRRAGESQNRMF